MIISPQSNWISFSDVNLLIFKCYIVKGKKKVVLSFFNSFSIVIGLCEVWGAV